MNVDEQRNVGKREKHLIEPESINKLKEGAQKGKFPLIEEYDFKRSDIPKLNIELKPNTMVRDY
jgi:hypothetical protein